MQVVISVSTDQVSSWQTLVNFFYSIPSIPFDSKGFLFSHILLPGLSLGNTGTQINFLRVFWIIFS